MDSAPRTLASILLLALSAACSSESTGGATSASTTTTTGGAGGATTTTTAAGGAGGGGGATSSAGGTGGSGGGASAAELLVGTWKEPPPTAYLRFHADGTDEVAKSVVDLDKAPFGKGTYTLVGDTLTFTNTDGVCAAPEMAVGVYTIAVDAASLTFTLVDDPCPQRNVIAGQTWTREP